MRHHGERTRLFALGDLLLRLWLKNACYTKPRRGAAATWVGRGAPAWFEQVYEAAVRRERGCDAVKLFLLSNRRLRSCFEMFFVDAILLLSFTIRGSEGRSNEICM